MSNLSKYLVEQILLEDTDIKKTVVVYSGRFQPFHKGHYYTYSKLVKKFGKDNVYIGTSDKTDNNKSPFNFKEKKQIMTTMFPISKDKVVQIKNPYKPTEILTKFDEKTTAYITAVGEKDGSRLGGKYFTKYDGNPTQGYLDKGYVFASPGLPISGTDVRNGLGNGSDDEKKEFFTKKVYPKFNKMIFNMLTDKLNESLVITKEVIEEFVLNEATRNGTGQADDGPTAWFPNMSVFDKISVKRAQKIGYEVVKMIMTKDLEDYYEHPTYPDGPANAVSYYPAGVIGKMTPNNQVDVYSSGAYSMWYKHVTRKASLVGYEVIQTQLQRSAEKKLKHMSGETAKADKEIEAEFELMMNETITLPVEIGDTLLMGKWKNKKVVVKTIGEDEHGMPLINGKKVVTFRYGKKGPNIFDNIVELEELSMTSSGFKNLGVPRKNMPQIKSTDLKDYLNWLKNENTVSYKITKTPINKLELTQKDIDQSKVEKLKDAPHKILSKPIIVSSDNFVLDGHHRIVALFHHDPTFKISTVRVNLSMKELLKITDKYPKVEYKKIDEVLSLTEATDKLKINIPANIKKLQKLFKKSGFKLYVVGGAVRDAILGKKPHDFDLTTDAKPDQVLKIARDNNLSTAEVGKKFGVVIVDGDEIATFRKDIGKGRRPEAVDYTDIEGDVKRRDLTINALFYDLDREEIVDLVGGIADLKKKKIRTVGKAEERFDEDELRKLRAFRFHARVGGRWDKETEAALRKNVSLNGVSGERIHDEFIKSIESAKSVSGYLKMIEDFGYLKLIFPNLKITKPYIDESDYKILIAYLLQTNTKLESKLNKLKYSAIEARDIEFLVNLKTFKSADIYKTKSKQDKQIHLTDDQILKFGKHTGSDLKKFVNFKLKLKGKDIPKGLKKDDIGNWFNKEEEKRFMNEGVKPISNFKSLFSKLPSELQKRIFALKHIGQNPKWHPEGNVLKHTIMVVDRAMKSGENIDYALAAIFHDIGKDETSGIHKKTGKPTHYGHEKVSAQLVKKYTNLIKKLGGDPETVEYIVGQHMRVKKFGEMRPSKQDKLKKDKHFSKAQRFQDFDKGGLGEAFAVKGNKIHKFITGKNLTYKGKKYPEIEFEVLGTDNGNKVVQLRILSPKKIFGNEMNVTFRTIKRGPFLKTETGKFNEMARKDLKQIEKFADNKLNPADVQFTNHFFDRVNDSRNGKEITPAELIGFFKRLARHKKEFIDFLSKYKEFTITDKKTNINIPLVKQANKIIAKTVMRKGNWKSHDHVLTFEDINFKPDLAKQSKTWYKLDTKDILKISNNIIDLVQTAYKKTPDGSYVNNKSDLNKSVFWNAIDVDGSEDADAVIFGRKSPNGIKIQGMGHDGDRQSINSVLKRLQKVLKTNGYWVEASDALEHVLYKMGVPYISSEKEAQSIFPNSELKMIGKKGKYTRKLQNGKEITETIFGKPKTSVKEDKIPGGLADDKTLGDIANHHKVDIDDLTPEYRLGIKTEKEHTTDNSIASEIARDHLWEDPKYYTKLEKMENENDSIEELYSDINEMLSSIEEGLFNTDNSMKSHDKLIAEAVTAFMKSKFGFGGKITVRKKTNDSLIGDVVLNDNSIKKHKFTVHYNPNQSLIMQIKSLIHELTHVKQIAKGELKPSLDYKYILWNGKATIAVSDYKKTMKNIGEYKKLPWEAEAYSNMDKLYKPFLQSRFWKELKGQDSTIDYSMDMLGENIITEGGAYGHMHHPFDAEINLTFKQLKDIISKALSGKLEFTREKTDGQALAVSWKNGKLIAARNKGHLKNGGENALDIKGIADKFKNRGGLTDAYNFAMQDLSVAIGKLSNTQKEKIFKDGHNFMNIEVIWPESVNVIPYGQPLLVFHGTMEYNDDGVAIGEDTSTGKILNDMLSKIEQKVQKNYTLQGPPVINLPKNKDLTKLKSKYSSKLSKLQKEFGLKDGDGVAMYHQKWWEDFIDKKSPESLSADKMEGLVRRWAFSNKSFRLDKKNFPNEKTLAWAKLVEKTDQKKISKENLMKFEDIFLGVGADVLEFTKSVLTVNPDKAIRAMKDTLETTIKDVQKSGDENKIKKLELELRRLNSIGGKDKLVPSEGIVFVYNGHTMKLTGAFASLNQILGIFFR